MEDDRLGVAGLGLNSTEGVFDCEENRLKLIIQSIFQRLPN